MGCHLGILLLDGNTETAIEGGGPMEIFAGLAIVLMAFWLRGKFYRAKFRRALKAMDRGGAADRAARVFWKFAGVCAVVIAIWLYLKGHAR
jgi:hypothetical protein